MPRVGNHGVEEAARSAFDFVDPGFGGGPHHP